MGAQSSEHAPRRDARGVIDISFYKARAERLRREAAIEFPGTVGRHVRAWLHSLRRIAAARSSMP
jgi:hypothetical protein